MHHKTQGAAVVALAILAGNAFAQFGTAPAELSLIKLTDDLYVIHNELVPGNVTALVTDDGVLLVDNKYAIDYDNEMKLLRTVTDKPVVYTIDTHYHDDHSGSNANLQATGTHVFAAERARAKMIESGRTEGLPDVTIDAHTRLYLGGVPVDIYYFGRAHTDGDVVVHFPRQRVLAAGDIFVWGEGLPELVDYPGGGSARAWTGTLDGALKLDFDRVVPGHGDVQAKAVMAEYRESTVRLQQMVHSMIQQKKSRDEIATMLRNEFGFEDFHLQLSLDGLLVELR
jgi:cyclase